MPTGTDPKHCASLGRSSMHFTRRVLSEMDLNLNFIIRVKNQAMRLRVIHTPTRTGMFASHIESKETNIMGLGFRNALFPSSKW